MRVIILPGNGCSESIENCNWYGWAKKELQSLNLFDEVVLRLMPDPVKARENIWIPFIKDKLKADEHTVIVGHSSGAVAAMRLAETTKLLGMVLVAACHTDLGDEGERLAGWYARPWNWETIQQNCKFIIQFHSNNDCFIPLHEARHVARSLRARYYELDDRNHFFTPFPELIEQIRITCDQSKDHPFIDLMQVGEISREILSYLDTLEVLRVMQTSKIMMLQSSAYDLRKQDAEFLSTIQNPYDPLEFLLFMEALVIQTYRNKWIKFKLSNLHLDFHYGFELEEDGDYDSETNTNEFIPQLCNVQHFQNIYPYITSVKIDADMVHTLVPLQYFVNLQRLELHVECAPEKFHCLAKLTRLKVFIATAIYGVDADAVIDSVLPLIKHGSLVEFGINFDHGSLCDDLLSKFDFNGLQVLYFQATSLTLTDIRSDRLGALLPLKTLEKIVLLNDSNATEEVEQALRDFCSNHSLDLQID